MAVQNVSSIGKASFQGNFKKTTEVKTAPNKIKDDKKKLALTLGGLAVAGIATIGIICKIKSGEKISQKETKATVDIAKNVVSDSIDHYTRYKGGIGKYIGTPCKIDDKTITQTINFAAPNSTSTPMFLDIIEDDTKKTIGVFRHTPQSGVFLSSGILMEKDANGNIIKVVNSKYNKGVGKGGQKIVTTIQRDEVGKVIGSNRIISEILPEAKEPQITKKRHIPA